jgi:Rrf2 family protein
MRISAKTDYAVRAMIELAAADRGLLSGHEIAELQDIPRQFLDGILGDLRRAGLVVSRRGINGGYRLARPATEIMVAHVIRAVDGPLATVRGERPENLDYAGAAGSLQTVWIAVRAQLRRVLDEVSIAEIAAGTLPGGIAAAVHEDSTWS